MKNILVVVAHADDEALGCGGTIAKHSKIGDTIELIVMTDGVSARSDHSITKTALRSDALYSSMGILGIRKVHQFNFADNQMDGVCLLEVVDNVEEIIKKFKPQIIYTHSQNDLNIDHRITASAVATASRPQPSCSIEEIYAMEILSSTNWNFPSATAKTFYPTKFNIVLVMNSNWSFSNSVCIGKEITVCIN